jgi:putative membrane protein
MMSFDFSTPQRQSTAGIIIMAAYTLQQVIRVMFVPMAILLIKSDKASIFYFIIGLMVLLAICLIYAYFYFLKFTFYLDQEKQEFIVDKGVFNRTHLAIPLAKIQQVNINQSFLQKIISVYSVALDTAGTDSKEVSIKAVNEKLAYSLKEHLLNGKSALLGEEHIVAVSLPQNNITEAPLIKINAATLLKIGLTTNYGRSIALLIGFAYAVFHNIKELLKAFDNDHGQIEQFFKSGFTLISISVLLAVLIILLLTTNVVRTFIKYFDFQISKHQQSLLISSGLFAKKNTLLSPNKVQITAYNQNYFQKKIGLFNMVLKQAHAGKEQSDKETKNNNMEVPGCSPSEKDEIIQMILGKLPSSGTMYKPNVRFLNLPIFFEVIIPVVIFTVFYSYTTLVRPFLPVVIIYVVIVLLMTYLNYTKHCIMVSTDFIIKQSGIWEITKEIIEPHKIQSITTFQYPWHKSADVGHVNLHTAAGTLHFKYGNYTEIKQLVNLWLYQIESTEKTWM